MPRASSQGSKAIKSGYGIQEGVVKVIDARYKNVQNNKKDGTATTPFFALQLDCLKLDDQLAPENEEDVQVQNLIIQFGSKETHTLDKVRFHPGKATGADDTDPEDMGSEIGAEGNMMWAESGDTVPFEDTDYIIFMKSLEKFGWKPEINDQSYAPNYIGAVFAIKTINKPLAKNAKAGDKPQTCWEVTRVYERPYEKKAGGKGAGKGASTAAASSKANGKESSTGATTTVQADETTANAFGAALTTLATTKSGSDVKMNDFRREIASSLMKSKPAVPITVQKAVVAAMKVPEWVEEMGAGVILVDKDADMVTFA